jgi:cysteine dioxygenase
VKTRKKRLVEVYDDRHVTVEAHSSTSPSALRAVHTTGRSPSLAMPAIRTVNELVQALKAGPGDEGYLNILRRVDIPSEEFSNFCRWNEKHYTRTCIARTEHFELLLICYEPGQRTSIHDYDTEEAWVRTVQGSIVEERFELDHKGDLVLLQTSILDQGSFSHLAHGHSIHRYTNAGSDRVATLNLYAKPLLKWKVYEERA